jgi:uncharacterized protein
MAYQIEAPMALAWVTTRREADELPTHYDPVVVETETIALPDLIEDELLLALPLVALHAPETCAVRMEGAMNKTETPSRRENPFAVLAQMKTAKRGK